MAGSNEQFKANFAALLKKAGDKVDDVVRQLAIKTQNSLIMKSPVDTGRFKSNWACGVNAINSDTSNNDDKTPLREFDAHAASLRTQEATLKFKAGDMINLTNSLPYAQRLEYGWSKQAPSGMVRLTALEIEQDLKKIIAEVK